MRTPAQAPTPDFPETAPASAAARRFIFNGKFLTAQPTGVHRVAHELIRAVDDLLGETPPEPHSWELLCPPDVGTLPDLAHIRAQRGGRLTWQFWEQIELPRLSRGAVPVNLCNLGPLASRNGFTLIHDAQVFSTPGSYSRAFRTWYQQALPILGARSARILTVSEFSRAQLATFGVAPLGKISVIPNGGDHILRAPSDSDRVEALGLDSTPFVVALANTQVHKNIAVLLDAFRSPALERVKLVLVGQATATDFTAAGHAPPDNVVFAGRVTDGQLRGLLERAVCLAFPSTTEGFGLPPLEAMMLGCAVVAAPCGAIPEVCGEAALYIAPHDAAAWAEGIAAVAFDADRLGRLQSQGRAQARGRTWANSARRLMKVLTGGERDGV